MSNPLVYYLIPVKDPDKYQVEFEEALRQPFINPNDVDTSRKYKFTNLEKYGIFEGGVELPTDDGEIYGSMSPTEYLSLPPYHRKKFAIPSDAALFAFMHPPPYLADYLCRNGIGRNCESIDDEALQISMFSMFGGYVYFNEEMEPLSINILTPIKTEYVLELEGPYPTSDVALNTAVDMNRFGLISTEITHEIGIVEKAWIRPGEQFQMNCATDAHDCAHGAFIFRRDSGESFTYVVTASIDNEMDLSKNFGRISNKVDIGVDEIGNGAIDIFDLYKPTSKFMTHMDDRQLDQRIKSVLKGRNFTSASVLRNLLNEAIKKQRSLQEIEQIMRNLGEGNLDHYDDYGWTALHYACRFAPDNESLIAMLIANTPDSVDMSDRFNRYPLHIACDSSATIEVIRLLLKSITSRGIVSERTMILGRLPLHMACSRGLSKEIVCALLDADKDGKTVRRKTQNGRNALHFALEMRLDDVIEVLLQADTKLNNTDVDFNSDDDDIYQIYHGILPLHYACSLNGICKTVRLLLEKDCRHTTIFQCIGTALTSNLNKGSGGKASFPRKRFSELTDRSLYFRKSNLRPDSMSPSKGMRPLHIALAQGSVEISRLVLLHEKQASKSIDDRQRLAVMVDVHGRTCLHFACMRNMEPDIIRNLLELDPSRVSTTLKDDKGCTPLHLACMHESANIETVQMIIDAESEYCTNHYLGKIKSTSAVNMDRLNPLSVAILAKGPNKVIELLLKPTYFDMTGMGPALRTKLAQRVQRYAPLQRALNLTLAQRDSFVWLFYNLIINGLALSAFISVIEPDFNHKEKTVTFGALVFSCASFLARELIQIAAQKSRYLADTQNLFDLLNVSFMVLSVVYVFIDDQNRTEGLSSKSLVLMSCSILLCIHTIFSLRSFFLPFARFARGTEVILVTLIPFFVTTGIMLLMFVLVFRIYHLPKDDGTKCEKETSLKCMCRATTGECLEAVLHGFFSGPGRGSSVFDVLYGIIVVIVLLNVVIAIVSDAWLESKEHAMTMYWQGRVSFLSESTFSFHNSRFPLVNFLFQWIDSVHLLKTKNRDLSWEVDYPYNEVKFKAQYDDPFYYFTPDIAHKIKDAHSLSSDIHWARAQSKTNSSEPYREICRSYLKWTSHTLLYALLLLIGIPTFGATWPLEFRFWLLSIGDSSEEDVNERENGDSNVSKQN